MPKFHYLASQQNGKMTEGEMDAAAEGEVLAHLHGSGLFPVSITQIKKGGAAAMRRTLFEKLTALDKITLAKNLALMIKAGIGIAEAIDIMLDDTQKPVLKKILQRAKLHLEKGGQLSEAFDGFPRHFSPIFINLLRAGEASGNLEGALTQIATQLKKEHDLRKKVTSAMAYPMVLVFAALGVVTLLVTVVLPRVSKIFAQSHVKLPWITRMLLDISDFVTTQWPLVLIVIAGIWIALAAMRRSSTGWAALSRVARRLPLLHELLQKITLARFCTTMRSLLAAGVPIIKSLEITADSLGNAAYKTVILDITQQEVARGISLGAALKRRPEYFPRMMTSMIVVGEKSGNLEVMLENLGMFYEEEVDNTLKTLITMLEPALLLAVGVIIGTLALSIIIPIYQLIGTVK
ncbi:MAG: type II secretion system F family protein [Patescibacteria group bacterium]